MRQYEGPVRHVNAGTGHSFRDANNLRVPGVTSVTGHLPKDALINWSVGETVNYAIDHWGELSQLPISERIKRLSSARWEKPREKAFKGTQAHKLADRLSRGESVRIPEGMEGDVRAIVSFLDEWDVDPVYTEAVIMSHSHGYAGRIDTIADLSDQDGNRERWLIDYKRKDRAYGETALQLAGYRFADTLVVPETGEEIPMPEVDRCGVVLIMNGRYELRPVEAEEAQLLTFLALHEQVGEFLATQRDLIGDPLEPPTLTTYRLSEVEPVEPSYAEGSA